MGNFQNIIEVKLTGNQGEYVDYNGQDTTITFSANLSTSRLLPTFNKDIKLTKGQQKLFAIINGEFNIFIILLLFDIIVNISFKMTTI